MLTLIFCTVVPAAGLSGCRGTEHFSPLAENDEEWLAIIELSAAGALLSSTPLSAPGSPVVLQPSGDPDSRFLALAFSPEALEALFQVAESAGLDGQQLAGEQAVTRASGCAPSYPKPRAVYELFDGRLAPLDDLTAALGFDLGAPWLEDACAPLPVAAPEFVSSVVIQSSCAACPSSELRFPSACRMSVSQTANHCSSVPDELTVLRNWRGEFCIEASSVCTSLDASQLSCATAGEPCELELGIYDFGTEDIFAVPETVSETPAVLTGILPRGSEMLVASANVDRTDRRCPAPAASSFRYFDLETGALLRQLEFPECILHVGASATSTTFVAVSVTAGHAFELLELDGEATVRRRVAVDPTAVLGVGPNNRTGVGSLSYWPSQRGYALNVGEIGDGGRSAVLAFVPAGEEEPRVVFGPRFTVPAGSLPARILDDGPAGPGHYWVSGGSWAGVGRPDEEVLFRDLTPVGVAAPSARDFGALNGGQLWLAGTIAQSAKMLALRGTTPILATYGELSGVARTFVPWGPGLHLVIQVGSSGTHAVRFDVEQWRFLPGSIRIDERGTEELSQLGVRAQAPDGSLWIGFADGTVLRVLRPAD